MGTVQRPDSPDAWIIIPGASADAGYNASGNLEDVTFGELKAFRRMSGEQKQKFPPEVLEQLEVMEREEREGMQQTIERFAGSTQLGPFAGSVEPLLDSVQRDPPIPSLLPQPQVVSLSQEDYALLLEIRDVLVDIRSLLGGNSQ
ncbi:MAG: hypothetical protein OXD50_04600 [Chloroflexi bacterium]|nr:hypothetical protein [Chloroflexota bacterium]